MKKILLVSVVASVLSGCANSPGEDVAERIEAINEAVLDQEELEQEKREKEIDAAPDWVLQPPHPDATGMYGVGIAQSKRLGHGLKSARLQAEFAASMYKQELSGSERAYEQGGSDGDVTTQTTFLIDKIVDAVPVVGYQVIEQIVKPIAGVNNVYVLLKLPYDQFNKVLADEKAKALNKDVQIAFDDLERRLDKRRTQKQEEADAKFSREQEAIKTRADILKQQSESEIIETSQDASNLSPLNSLIK
ncbi:LPP20 family lipoprotein [Colwellia sp. MSW7]|uniref:LPP20 family lipoprotein n=1 Tax=Colwellia maritima TaxID=2912588 RepID=A0ABS9X6Q2_9GAMM|nr:LPP20 family lipoprotein [Colwellia maritima]MCI2285921.1 LPP20 family lipoprotein [Colwellia maritima]